MTPKIKNICRLLSSGQRVYWSKGIYRADLVAAPPSSVPEPASTLGLLVFGAIAASYIFNKRTVKHREVED